MSFIPSCLNNLVGLSTACDKTVPTSGLYFDEATAINLTAISHVVEDPYPTATAWFNSKVAIATKHILDKLRPALDGKFRLNGELDTSSKGEYENEYYDYLNHSVGIKIARVYERKEFQAIKLAYLTILADDTANVNLIIDDGVYGVYPYPILLVQGQIFTQELNLTLYSSQVLIYLETAKDVRLSKVHKPCSWGCCSGWGGWMAWGFVGWFCGNRQLLKITGWDKTENKSSCELYGIIPYASLICDFSSLYCEIKDDLALPIIFQTAVEYYKSLSSAGRVNAYTTLSQEEIARQIGYFYGERDIKLKIATENLRRALANKSRNNECITCTGMHVTQGF